MNQFLQQSRWRQLLRHLAAAVARRLGHARDHVGAHDAHAARGGAEREASGRLHGNSVCLAKVRLDAVHELARGDTTRSRGGGRVPPLPLFAVSAPRRRPVLP